MKQPRIAYSRGRAKHDASPEQRHASTFQEFQEAILQDRAKAKGEAYFCAPCKPNGDGRAHRDKGSVLPSSFLSCDFDALTPSQATFVRKVLAQWQGFAYTTPSSTRDKPRLRAVIALRRAVIRDEQLRIGTQLQAKFRENGIELDANQFRPEQCADVPVGNAKAWRFRGKPLNVDLFLAAPLPSETAADTRAPGKVKAKRHDYLLSLLPDIRRLPPHLRRAAILGINAELFEKPLERAEVEALVDWAANPAEEWRPHLDFKKLDALEPPRPQFIAPGILAGYACGLYGHGGAGKSFIALLLAVCIATGTPFCGMPVERRRVGWFSDEDRAGVLHARLSHICRYLKVRMADLDGRLFVYDLVGQDTVLYAPNTRGADPRTIVFSMAADRVREHDLEVLFFDGLAGFFAGNENVRTESKGFVNLLLSLIPPDRGAVVVLGHIDKLSARNDAKRDAYSGSTGWWNAFRTLFLLSPETVGAERTDRLILELQKSNHGTVGTQFEFRWNDVAQMFVGASITPVSPTERAQQEQAERNAILDTLRLCMAANNVVPAALTGPRTSWHVLSQHPAFPTSLRGTAGKRRLAAHLEALRASGDVLETEHVRANRHRTVQLVARSEGRKERKF